MRAEDLEATREFYVDVLGFEVSMEVGDFLLFSSPNAPDVQVSVNETPEGAPPAAFAVDVGSPDRAKEIYDALVSRGVTVTEEIEDKPWGIRRFGVVDPDGVRVTILCHLSEEP